MRAAPSCPRCFEPLHAPSPWSSAWRCGVHGDVLPLQPALRPSASALDALIQRTRVPVWLPWPLPPAWLVTGFAWVGDERSGARAGVVAISGPSIVDGPADMLLVAEEPGVGLGAAYAGLPGPDPGPGFGAGPSHAKLDACGHPTALWCVEGADDRAVYVGEALGHWLWAVAWPPEAGVLVALEELDLRDLRDGALPDLPYGALTPRLGGEAGS
ncbi:DUF6758 family protein [Bailinhaonella thermotolerans]|uniref:Phosphotransacetylase n=1 Tax=Bailinhaonella thermotolerans TaxID=1070861 RepID=A0A3A4B564_9ACTN|nr:DUF6758 family protein [Bailinhaonella thermotolerans]RJL33477.1 hypothetical protein D5H75_11905 [Bailinhaonella thermotolerans]